MIQNKIDLSPMPNAITYPEATNIEIQKVEVLMAVQFPHVYKDLLTYTNGFSIASGMVIYGTQEILERNETWEVKEYASGYVAIGDDGGGRVFLMLQDAEEKAMLIVDAGDMNPNHATGVTSDFLNWVNGGCVSEQPTIVESPDFCDILLVNVPSGGLKDLLAIKRVFGFDISAGDLLKASKKPPFLLGQGFPSGKAKKCIEQLELVGESLSMKY